MAGVGELCGAVRADGMTVRVGDKNVVVGAEVSREGYCCCSVDGGGEALMRLDAVVGADRVGCESIG
jgi:hypothetical protein